MVLSDKYLSVITVFGGFLLQFTIGGAQYSFGNLTTYLVSYMRFNGSPDMTYTHFLNVMLTWGLTQGITMPFSGFIISVLGNKVSMILGVSIFSAGCALTNIAIQYDLWLVSITYGCILACGHNIALIPTLTAGMNWFPNHKGLVMGIIVSGYGCGSLFFNAVQTEIVNPNNVNLVGEEEKEKYIIDMDVLNRVPNLLLILAAIYFSLGMLGAILVFHPSSDLMEKILRNDMSTENTIISTSLENVRNSAKKDGKPISRSNENPMKEKLRIIRFVCTRLNKALRTKAFYLLWVNRLSNVMISDIITGLYKSFGTTFIKNDKFLSLVGTIASVFNCSGRILYGVIMDNSSYRFAMITLTTLLTILSSTFYLTSLLPMDSMLQLSPAKVFFALWVWLIYLTFPGTYAMQPAVTAQLFGHQDAGKIYPLLFTADIVHNITLLLIKEPLVQKYGYGGIFWFASGWGVISFAATLLLPANPNEERSYKIRDEI